jgi:hypothetical protein
MIDKLDFFVTGVRLRFTSADKRDFPPTLPPTLCFGGQVVSAGQANVVLHPVTSKKMKMPVQVGHSIFSYRAPPRTAGKDSDSLFSFRIKQFKMGNVFVFVS